VVHRFLIEPDQPELPPRETSSVERAGLDNVAPKHGQAMHTLRMGNLVPQVDRTVSNVMHRTKTTYNVHPILFQIRQGRRVQGRCSTLGNLLCVPLQDVVLDPNGFHDDHFRRDASCHIIDPIHEPVPQLRVHLHAFHKSPATKPPLLLRLPAASFDDGSLLSSLSLGVLLLFHGRPQF
jgi:hypothetical protein